MLAKAMGARVIAVDSVANRLEMSKRFGADEVVDASKVDPVEVIRGLTHGEGADAAMDCTGVGVARVNTLNAARQWGRVCFVGVGGPTTFDVTVQIIRKNLTIYGTLTFSSLVLAEVAKFVIAHKLPLRETITHTFPLSKADEAYKLFDTGTTGKMALIP
jgi:L-iditol 2-dehydrogenase